GACKEVIRKDNFSLNWFPILQCWPKDAGRFITLPCVITRDPKTGKRNVGCYRMQVYEERATGMHWQRQKIGAEHYREALRNASIDASLRNSSGAQQSASTRVDVMARTSGGSVLIKGDQPSGKMEVAVALGTDPAVTFSSIVPAPPDVEEYLIAGFLRQKPVELVKCETVDLEIPATAEIVLEGHVHLDELRSEGPFGDHTGFYSLEDLYPVFHLSCITHRKNHIDPERDIQFTLGPIDSLDHASRLPNYGSKMGIDATRKWPSEGFTRPWPDEILMDEKTKQMVDTKWKALAKELGLEQR